MIHDYYCTNCGHKIPGKKVIFNLAQILELGSGKSMFIKFTSEDLWEVAERNGVDLRDGRVRLKISIYDLLGYMAQDLEDEADQDTLQGLSYEEFAMGAVVNDLFAGSYETPEVAKEKTEGLVKSIISKFLLEKQKDTNIAAEKWEQSIEHYVTWFWVETIFFEGTDTIYTLKYSCEEASPNVCDITWHKQGIRGYCPECCEPVLRGSGKYEHILVGFLGAQSAGKTSLFVSMINYLEKNHGEFDVSHPEFLCDGKYEKITKAKEANKKGWAVTKTDSGAVQDAYNASLFIKRNGRSCLLSFIDIAGDLCWNEGDECFDQDALKKFPLISHCQMYMLCEDVKPEDAQHDSRTLIIARDLYRRLDDPLFKPPMCLIITKIDMARGANSGPRHDNPFNEHNFARRDIPGSNGFQAAKQIAYLRDVYDSAQDEQILESLRECVRTYKNHRRMTYMSIIGCSALGMPGRSYEEEKQSAAEEGKRIPDFKKDGDRFNPLNLEDVWRWIFCNIGILSVVNNYRFADIPSYGEAYLTERIQWNAQVRLLSLLGGDGERKIYPKEEMENRINAIYSMYLNPSKLDQALYIFQQEEPVGGILGWLGTRRREAERIQIIEDYIEHYSEE